MLTAAGTKAAALLQLLYEINSSVRSSAGWNNILVHNLSCQCTDASLGNNNAGRERQIHIRVSTCVRKIKKPSLPRQRGLTDSPKRHSAGAWCWPVLTLAAWPGSRDHRQGASGGGQSTLLSLPTAPISTAHGLRPWGLCNDRDCWEKLAENR